MRSVTFWATYLVLVASQSYPPVCAQSLTDQEFDSVFKRAEPWVVRLRVTGTRDGRDVTLGNGNAFIAASVPDLRLLTARHVVGRNEEFDRDPTSESRDVRKRNIAVEQFTDGPREKQWPILHRTLLNSDHDVAQIFTAWSSAPGALMLEKEMPKTSESLVVVSWEVGQQRPHPMGVRVEPREVSDGPAIRLRSDFVGGESGSPVLNRRGAVVAILIERSKAVGGGFYAKALPVAEFKNWLPIGYFELPSDEARKRNLALFKSVIEEIQKSQIVNDEFVFPAMKRYLAEQTKENWEIVVAEVRKSLAPIEEGIALSIRYDAQLMPAAEELRKPLSGARATGERSFTRTFREVRAVWNGRFHEKKEILRYENVLPTAEEVSRWYADLRKSYEALAAALAKFYDVMLADSR